jgi:hypothetical protein
MDYLHGDVVDSEFKAACAYEYARESNIVRKAAELLTRDLGADPEEIGFKIEAEFHCGSWFIQNEWSFIWQCPSFPAKGWNELSAAERSELLWALPLSTNQPRPLVLGEVMFLTGYLDQLKDMAAKGHLELNKQVAAEAQAAKARAEGKKKVLPVTPRQKFYPVLQIPNTPFVQALLPLDFRKSRQRLLQEIDYGCNSRKTKLGLINTSRKPRLEQRRKQKIG